MEGVETDTKEGKGGGGASAGGGALEGGLVKTPASVQRLMMDEEERLRKKSRFELEMKDILSSCKFFLFSVSCTDINRTADKDWGWG